VRKRSILGVSVTLSVAEAHWRDFLASLAARGLHGVRLVVSDRHAGLTEVLDARLTGVPWQRCQFHLIENSTAFVPKPSMPRAVAACLWTVFDAPHRPEAERQLGIAVKRYRAEVPRLAEWLEANAPEGLAVFGVPANHRRRAVPKRGVGASAGQRSGDGDQRGVGDEPRVPDDGAGLTRGGPSGQFTETTLHDQAIRRLRTHRRPYPPPDRDKSRIRSCDTVRC
jgi:hypothetical protein